MSSDMASAVQRAVGRAKIFSDLDRAYSNVKKPPLSNINDNSGRSSTSGISYTNGIINTLQEICKINIIS